MNAVKGKHTLRQVVLEDARLTPDGSAHLESNEVPTWINETSKIDIAGEVCEAISDLEGKEREKLNDLLTLVCEHGDEISQRRSLELIELLRMTLTAHCVAQAQTFVDRAVI